MIRPSDLMLKGGEWIGSVRNWIQWNCTNGDRVTWNTDDEIHTSKLNTVNKLQEFGAIISAAAMNQERERIINDVHRAIKDSLYRDIFISIVNKDLI